MNADNQSEVARLLRQIEQEYEAAQRGLSGLAFGVSQHEFITAKMERIQQSQEALGQLVGKWQATKLVAETLEKA